MNDRIDIVIVNDNCNGLIQECVERIRKHSEGYNLIIVDLNSYDGSKEWLIESKVSPHLILTKGKGNVARARNQAIRVGSSPWMVFISPDMLIEDPLWLDKMWNYTIDRNIGFIEAGVIYQGTSEETKWFAALDFCMIRRTCLSEVGAFDERIFDGKDLDWLIRLEWSNWRTGYCFDIDIKSKASINRGEVFGNELIKGKYNHAFIQKTLRENSDRRKTKEFQLYKQTES